jgi:hypothetical protein
MHGGRRKYPHASNIWARRPYVHPEGGRSLLGPEGPHSCAVLCYPWCLVPLSAVLLLPALLDHSLYLPLQLLKSCCYHPGNGGFRHLTVTQDGSTPTQGSLFRHMTRLDIAS